VDKDSSTADGPLNSFNFRYIHDLVARDKEVSNETRFRVSIFRHRTWVDDACGLWAISVSVRPDADAVRADACVWLSADAGVWPESDDGSADVLSTRAGLAAAAWKYEGIRIRSPGG
jgi:hypothetical protein